MSADLLSGHAWPASFLFVPATRPDRVDKAFASGAHEVIVDLEDAVAAADKERGRENLRALRPSRPVHVRVNPRGTEHGAADIAAVAELGFVNAVVLPKTESASDVRFLVERLPDAMCAIGLVESARGVVAVDEIASSGVERLMFGIVDYCTDLHISPSPIALAYARGRIAVACAAARIAPPIDGPATSLTDTSVVAEEAELARGLGFGGKLCVHPSQVDPVNESFRATPAELEWAGAVIAEAERRGTGVFAWNGEMIDEPVVERARNLLGKTPAGVE